MSENQLVQPEQEEAVAAPVAEDILEEQVEEAGSETAEQTAVEEETEETSEEKVVDKAPEIDPDSKLSKALEELEKLNNRLGYEQRQREKLEREIRQSQQMPRIDGVNAPKQDDFETYEEYQQAFIDYRIASGISDYQRRQVQSVQQSSIDGFIDETTIAGREKYNDFDSVVLQNHVPITQPMLQIMQNCEHPESIAYYLGKNLKDATAISRMSPIQQVRAITNIENKVKTELNAISRPGGRNSQKTVSKAPPPVKPTGSANVINKDPEKMTQAEYEAWRAKGGGR